MKRTYEVRSDSDAMNLGSLLIVSPADECNEIIVIVSLHGWMRFTEKGAKIVAELIRKMESPTVDLHVSEEVTDIGFVDNVAKILYLEGNKPDFRIKSHSYDFKFSFDCFRLQQNDRKLRDMTFHKATWRLPSFIQFGTSLQGNTELQELTVWMDDNFTSDHAHTLAAGICNAALTTLVICNGWYMSKCLEGENLDILWREGIQASGTPLKHLQIKADTQGFDTSEWAETLSCIQTLSIENAFQSRKWDKFDSLCDGLERTSNLLGLSLEHCGLDDGAMTMLAIGLRNHRSMRNLTLSRNRIGNAGISALVENWPEDSKLELLDLGNNSIQDDGIQQLMTAVVNCDAMKILILHRNKFDCEIVGNHLPYLRLQEIELGHLRFYNQMTSTRTMQSFLRGIKSNYSIHDLSMCCLSDPPILVECELEITLYTKLNMYGRYLLRIASDVPPALWCLIFAKCRIESEFGHSIVFYFLVEQPHLVVVESRTAARPISL